MCMHNFSVRVWEEINTTVEAISHIRIDHTHTHTHTHTTHAHTHAHTPRKVTNEPLSKQPTDQSTDRPAPRAHVCDGIWTMRGAWIGSP